MFELELLGWKRNIFDNDTVYSWWTELFEIKLIICIKMDLALNNQQNPTNQPKIIQFRISTVVCLYTVKWQNKPTSNNSV